MEIVTLTARLEAQTAAFMAGMKAVETQLSSVERSITKLERSVSELTVAMKGIEVSPAQTAKTVGSLDTQTRAVKKLRDAYVEAAVAEDALGKRNFPGGIITNVAVGRDTRAAGYMSRGPFGPNYSGPTRPGNIGFNEFGYLSGAAQAERVRLMSRTGIRTQEAIALGAVASRVRIPASVNYGAVYGPFPKPPDPRMIGSFGEDFEGVVRQAETAARNARAVDYLNRIEGNRRFRFAGFGGGSSGGGGILGSGGSRGGGGRERRVRNDVFGPNFLAGALPGGRRAGVGAVLTALGLGVAATPTLAPAAVGLGAAASAGIVALVGGAATLKLAFADLNKAAFTTQKGFDALNPVQQKFVMSIRSLDAGFVQPLEQLASSRVLPGLTAALHQALTPGAAAAIQGGVGAFGGAISGGAQQFGKLFGSAGFSSQFGQMLQLDAKLLRDMFSGTTNLVDAFVRLSVAAGPLVNWMSKGVVQFTKWFDGAVKSGQATGALAGYFDKAKMSLQALGGLIGQVGKSFGALANAVGFKNSISTVNLLKDAVAILTDFLNRNRKTIQSFFSGAIKSAHDLIVVVSGLTRALGPLLDLVNKIAKSIGGWQNVIDTAGILWITKFVMMKKVAVELGTAVSGIAGAKGIGGLIKNLGLLKTLGLAGISIAILYELLKVPNMDALAQALVGSNNPNDDITKSTGKWVGSGFQGVVPYGPQKGQNFKNPAPGIVGPFGDGNYYTVDSDGFLGNTPVRPVNGMRIQNPKNGSVYTYRGNNVDPRTNPRALGPVFSHLPARLAGASIGASATNPFGKSDPLQGTGKAGTLPIALQTAIDSALYSGNAAKLNTAIHAALAYVNNQVKSTTNKSTLDLLFQEGTALKSQLVQAAGGKPSLLTQVFSASRQAAFSKAQARFGSASASGSPAMELQGVNQMLRVAGDQLTYLMGEQGTVTKGSKKWLEIVKELKVVQDAITGAQKEQIKALKDLAKEQKAALTTATQNKWDRLLHIGPGESTSAQSVVRSERSTLLGLVKFIAPKARGGAGVVHDPYAAIPGATRMSVDQLIKSLQGHGVHFSKRALEDFATIKKILEESQKTGIKLKPTETAQIRALLKQISDNTKHLASFPSTYRLPSVKQIMEGLHGGTPELRKQIAERLVALGPLHGKLPTGPTAFGYPTGASFAHATAKAVAGHMKLTPVGWWNNPVLAAVIKGIHIKPVRDRGFDGSMTINGDVHITVSGAHGDAKRIAKNIREELVKTARRNTTQTKGSNAGRNLGMS